MHDFKDRQGRPWKIDLTIGEVGRLKPFGFDLWQPHQPRAAGEATLRERLLVELPLFWELLAQLVEPQLLAAGTTVVAFGEAMTPAELIGARQAFWREWADFFRPLDAMAARGLDVDANQIDLAIQEAKATAADPRIVEMEARMAHRMKELAQETLTKALAETETALQADSNAGPGASPASSE
jgi:hypothetical protein